MSTQPVAINARAAARREIGGVERVARELARRLPALAPARYRVIEPPAFLAHRAGHLWEQAVLPAAAHGARLVLSPANLAPLLDRRNAVVIHDVAALRHPEWYSGPYVAWQRRVLPRIARGAQAVFAPSAFAREEIVELLGAAPERVSVVAGGVDERFWAGADPVPAAERHGLGRPYALAVGTQTARKNLRALAPAARALGERGIDLVVAGSGRGYLRREGRDTLRELGYVDEALLPGLYAGALAVALPSLYEGFGLPCLEAMACGTPVVAADRGALPETCGDAALLVDPFDAGALAEALVSAATDDRTRERLREAGLARAAGFTWDRTAAEIDAVISRLLDAEGSVPY